MRALSNTPTQSHVTALIGKHRRTNAAEIYSAIVVLWNAPVLIMIFLLMERASVAFASEKTAEIKTAEI